MFSAGFHGWLRQTLRFTLAAAMMMCGLLVQAVAQTPTAPTLTSLSPNSVTAGGADFTLNLTGSNFTAGSVVRWNGADRPTNFISGTQLQAYITAADIASPGAVTVTVFTPSLRTAPGGTSNPVNFTINPPLPRRC
ncbi:MAG TPA: IPT/TIG domain-containing protein [Blastocatellia bacterium]|nr:IPT/TIG domain-containing protein [Blastocatellia bacterium]